MIGAFKKMAGSLFGSMNIMFKELSTNDFGLMLTWLEAHHIKAWWHSDIVWTLEAVAKKYANYVKGYKIVNDTKRPLSAFIIHVDDIPIGFIQYYNAHDFTQDFLRDDDLDISFLPQSCAGVDLFIGEERYIGKGVGPKILKKFLCDHVFKYFEHVFANPDINNTRSIKAFEKTGFSIIKTTDKVTCMLRAK